ncbi:MAG: inositol monophosphatase family protein [Acidobacteriota bacterium]
MDAFQSEHDILRYSRQVVLKAMDNVRARMRGSDRLTLSGTVESPQVAKAELNLTKGIDAATEELIVGTLQKKLARIPAIKTFSVFSEECGILRFPRGAKEADADLVVFVDPIDGTEFIESLQGGWCLVAVYDRRANETIVAVAGDIFLDRLYWASKSSYAEAIDFATHSWFKLDGGPNPKTELAGARVNFLTTKVGRYTSVAKQKRLLDAIKRKDGRINLSWGSNMIVQVAAGYADAAVEFTKGFATYDLIPGLFIGLRAGLTILDLKGNRIGTTLDIDEIFATWRRDPKRPKRMSFIAAKHEKLAREILELLEL